MHHLLPSLFALLALSAAVRLPTRTELFETFDQPLRVPYDEFVKSVMIFRSPDLIDFEPILLDEKGGQLLVGARDAVVRLKSNNLALIQRLDLPPSAAGMRMCQMKGQPESDCHNFIRTLVRHKDDLLVCGTNAYSPMCDWRKAENLSKQTHQQFSGIGAVPYSPHYNGSYVMSSEGQLYAGVVTDFSGHDPSILRIWPQSQLLRTAKANTRWLNQPNFVAAYEIGNFIYFFFREEATESALCGTKTVSRVARVCKNDVGGDVILHEYWTTYNKATLSCTDGNGVEHTKLQSAYFDQKSDTLFAVFGADNCALPGSAICSYDLESIRNAFTGHYLYQNNTFSPWVEHPNANQYFDCEVQRANSRRPGITTRRLIDAQSYQLMSDQVQPRLGAPLEVAPLERYVHIVMDSVRVKHHGSVQVIFVLTTDGLIKKFSLLPTSVSATSRTCLVEVVQVFKPSDSFQVTQMILDHKTDGLLIGTQDSLIKLPTHRCNRFKTRQQCVDSEDPYCGWNARSKECARAPQRITSHHYWHQNLDDCPKINLPVNGNFGQWTEWFPCPQMGAEQEDDCQCRTRTCDSPRPRLGGKNCQGPNIQVQNCTRHGGWTIWSDWSACTATCGVSMRRRARFCSDPSPAFGGRMCLGPDAEQQYCKQTPCPVPTPVPVHGQWSGWSSWDGCSRRCGGGIERRTRKCNNPAPANDGNSCSGCDVDYRVCNTEPCEELRRWSDWTPWLATNSTEGPALKRFKFSCRARIDDPKLLSVSSPRTQTKLCVKGAADCTDVGFAARDGGWSQWTSWSQCSEPCGNGTQTRIRTCSEPPPVGSGRECEGHAKEQRQCNAHNCQAEWSCWSEYSPCSVSCAEGVKHRVRQCNHQPGMRPCEGKRVETLVCDSGPCTNDGYGSWSSWSSCSELNVKVRIRPCLSNSYCNGIPDAQMKRCEIGAQSVVRQRTSSANIVLVVAIVGAFVVGVALTLVLSCWAVRRQSNCCYMFGGKKPPPRVPSTNTSPSKSTNIYTPPPTRNNVQMNTNGHIQMNPLTQLLDKQLGETELSDWATEQQSLTLRRAMRASMNPKDFL